MKKDYSFILSDIVSSGCSFAIYRLPDSDEPSLILQTDGEKPILDPEEQNPQGFILAPFHETKICPTMLIRPDIVAHGWKEIEKHTIDLPDYELNRRAGINSQADGPTKTRYENAFYKAMELIREEKLTKVVLATCRKNSLLHPGFAPSYYIKALDKFPHSMVTLSYTPKSGLWLGCSPELLLEGAGLDWSTVSLAGTMAWGDAPNWNTKNVWEQDIVTRYIDSKLNELGAKTERSRPYTVQAGPLMHRRTDFTFHLQEELPVMKLIRHLYPTPAICGIPQEEAYQFIMKEERIGRRYYYSGFLGPINMEGENHIYVNLRCMNLTSYGSYIYAGGGINCLSLLWEEEEELERKLLVLQPLER